MEHIGIDLGSRGSHICIRNNDAELLLETRVPTKELGNWLSQRPPAKVVVETCCESFTIADIAMAADHEVNVVPASIVRQLGVGHRGVKNDVRDARVLCRASLALGDELPSVHVPSHASRAVQRLLVLRVGVVKVRASLVNAIKAQLRSLLITPTSGTTSTLPTRVREQLADEPDVLSALEPVLQSLDTLTATIRSYDAKLVEQTKDNADVQRLKSVPGVGPIVAAAFVAAIDDVRRFPNAARLASYLGLTPGENTTGGKQRFTGVTRAGKKQLRALLIQSSWTLVRCAPNSPLVRRYLRLAEAKPKQVAIVATARRLACALYAMMRDKTSFNPTLGAPKTLQGDDQIVDSSAANQLASALRAST